MTERGYGYMTYRRHGDSIEKFHFLTIYGIDLADEWIAENVLGRYVHGFIDRFNPPSHPVSILLYDDADAARAKLRWA